MRCARRCLTHPALCEGRACADFLILLQRKIDIPYAHTHSHGKTRADGEHATDVLRRGTSETQENERRTDLGRVLSQDCRDRRRIKNRCLPRVRTSRKAGLVRQ